jgi:hypothetical protein
MPICPRCGFENGDAWDCCACGINIQWANLNPDKWTKVSSDQVNYNAAEKRKNAAEKKNGQGNKPPSKHFSYPTIPTGRSSARTNRTRKLFQNGTSITLKKNEAIQITKKTVSFGQDVYQFRNIVGFSEGEIELGNIIPIPLILSGFLFGLFLANFMTDRTYGVAIAVISILGMIINIAQSRKYGLLLTLNSGDKHLFVTTDGRGLARVVGKLREFMETDSDGKYVVTVNDNSITVHGSLTGVAASGNKETNISTDILS